MRNPVRLKNLRARFLPFFALGALVLFTSQPSRGSLSLGSIVLVLGFLLRGWGAGYLVKNDALTTAGPYAHVRHPLYVGTLLVGTGFALGTGGWWALAILVAFGSWFFGIYFPRKDRSEGARLEALYGEQYAAYRSAVPALWPRWRAYSTGSTERTRWSLKHYSENNELGTALALFVGWLLLAWRFTEGVR